LINNQKIILTGATSKTGDYFLSLLNKYQYKGLLIVLSRKKINLYKFRNLKIKIFNCDLKDVQKVNNISYFKGAYFLHIAGINYSKNILRFCILNKVTWLILTHTTGKFSLRKPESAVYNKIDDYIKRFRFKLGITFIYPTMIYGTHNDGNIFKLVSFLKKLFFIIPLINNGKNLVQPVFYTDVATAFYKIILKKKKTFNKEYILAGREPISQKELFINILNLLNKKYFFIRIPFFLIFNIINIVSFFIGKNNFYWFVLRINENRNFSIEKAINDFGYYPFNFKKGIELAFKNYFKKN